MDNGANGAWGEDLLALIDDDELDRLGVLACPACGANATLLSRAGPHIKATCGECSRYLKFVKQKLSPEERAKWDSLKK